MLPAEYPQNFTCKCRKILQFRVCDAAKSRIFVKAQEGTALAENEIQSLLVKYLMELFRGHSAFTSIESVGYVDYYRSNPV